MSRHYEQTVELADCNHCEAIILNPTSDECPNCGGEIYPVTHVVQPGTCVLKDRTLKLAEKPSGG